MQTPFVYLMAANKSSHFRRPFRIFIFFSAAAAIIVGGALLNLPLITLLVAIGISVSFLSLPLWWYVLQGV